MRLTPMQYEVLMTGAETLHKRTKWRRMTPKARELSKKVGYYDGDVDR